MILTNVGKLNYLTVKTLLNVKGYVGNENFLFESTHPDIAALVTPLSASRIEGISFFFFTLFAAKPQRGWSSEAQTG